MPDFPLPLPLTAFEEYMLCDDRPTYPMSIIARLEFSGRLDRHATVAALEAVVARHPLLRAKIRKTAAGRLEWAVADSAPAFSWNEGPGYDHWPLMRPIDLFSDTGLVCWAATDSQRSSLVLQVHHAVCDGKAVLQILDEFVRSYARMSTKGLRGMELPACNPDLLRGRGRFGLTVGKYFRMLPAQLTGLLGVWKFLMRRPVPLLDPLAASADELPANSPNVRIGSLKADEVRRLSAIAADHKVTVNDWFIRDFYLAINDFRSRHQITAAGQWIRFSIPMSLRQTAGRTMPATNLVSMVFLDRTPEQISDSAGLLRSIHDEMHLIRRRQLGLTFVLSLAVLRLLPGGLAKRVNKGNCEATCVLSNLGKAMADSPLPLRQEKIVAGNVKLDGIDLFSPIREGTAVSAALVYYAGGLQICMQYDRRRVTETQADDLIASYLCRIRTSLGATSPTLQDKAA
jgi:hypothetical protein